MEILIEIIKIILVSLIWVSLIAVTSFALLMCYILYKGYREEQ